MKKASLLIFVLLLINISLVQAASANDNFANATELVLTSTPTPTDSADFQMATIEAGEPLHTCLSPDGTGGASVWFKFTLAANSTVTLSTEGSTIDMAAGLDGDTVMSVYTGAAINALTSVACNDDRLTGSQFHSYLSRDYTAGTYYVQVSNSAATAPTNPSTVRLTASAVASDVVTELLVNGSFEDHVVKPSQPDNWNAVPTAKDRLKCGLEEGDFSRTGLCSYRFVGGDEERAKLVQSPVLDGLTLVQGDELTLRGYYDTNDVTPKLKVKMVITYTGVATPVVRSRILNTVSAGDFTGFAIEPYPLTGAVSKIKVQFLNRAVAGKIYIDDVSLELVQPVAR